jgi:N-acetylmuramoyl-L-alanine amidase
MAKVAIDAGHASDTNGKRTPSGYREHWFNVAVSNYIDIGLKRCGIQTLKVAWDDTNSKDDPEMSLGERQRQIKNAKCDIAISVHANASGDGKSYNSAQGVETFVHNTSDGVGDSKRLANLVHSYLIKGTQQTNRGVKSSGLAMCNCKSMGVKAAILIEYAFMTNQREEQLIKSDAFCKECAEETVHGICDYLGIKYITNGQTSQSSIEKKLYRVQCGAFSSEQNAKNLQSQLSSIGFNTTIKFDNGLYKVQVGAFGNKANAESLMLSVKDKGVSATVIYY